MAGSEIVFVISPVAFEEIEYSIETESGFWRERFLFLQAVQPGSFRDMENVIQRGEKDNYYKKKNHIEYDSGSEEDAQVPQGEEMNDIEKNQRQPESQYVKEEFFFSQPVNYIVYFIGNG
jgi:hypothetical protein